MSNLAIRRLKSNLAIMLWIIQIDNIYATASKNLSLKYVVRGSVNGTRKRIVHRYLLRCLNHKITLLIEPSKQSNGPFLCIVFKFNRRLHIGSRHRFYSIKFIYIWYNLDMKSATMNYFDSIFHRGGVQRIGKVQEGDMDAL